MKWKSHISLLFLMLMYSVSWAQPANDLCTNNILVTCGQTVTGNTSTATIDATPACGSATSNSVWYRFVGTGSPVTFSLCGSSYDTFLSIFTGSCAALTCVQSNDDSAACGAQSQITITTIAGTTYFIRVHGYSTASGAFSLTVNCPPAVTNDGCANAIPITCGQTIAGTTIGATTENITGCGSATSPSVWYTIVGNGQNFTLSLCGSGYDTQISVFTGSCAALTCLANNDDFAGCGLSSQVSFTSVLGTTYYIRVHGFGTSSGTFTLAATCATPPSNDPCSGAIPIACGQTVTGTTIGAAGEGITTCGGGGNSPSVWFSFIGDGQAATFSLCGSSYDTQISAFTGTCAALNCVISNDNFCGTQSQISIATQVGVTYYIRVHGATTGSGAFTLAVTCAPLSGNDPCSGAEPIECGQTYTGSTATATPDQVTACGVTNYGSNSVWYTFVGDGAQWTLSLCGSAYDTYLSVFSGSCSNLSCVASNDDFAGCGTSSQVTIGTTVGVNYYILVHGFGTSSGNFSLTTTCCNAVPANDLCGFAVPITCGQTVMGTTTCASGEVLPLGCYSLNGAPSVWYSIIGTGDYVTLSTCGSFFDTEINVFVGSCGALQCLNFNDDALICAPQSEIGFTAASGGAYYIAITSSDGSSGDFTLSASCGPPPPPTPQDCNGAISICNDTQFGGNASGTGMNIDLLDANNGCLSIEHQSSWYTFSPTTTGTIALTINPTPPVDYDFAIWGPYNSPLCPPVGDPIRCSFAATSGNTGLLNGSGDLTEGAGGNLFVEDIDVTATDLNRFYIMVIDNFVQSSTPFVVDWSLNGVILNCNIQLPIELGDFTAIPRTNDNALYWQTFTENNNELFIIERSADGERFESIGDVPGAINSLERLDYSFFDKEPFPGQSYYRLRQVDSNGQFSYTHIVSVTREDKHFLSPNPASTNVRIDLSPFNGNDGQIIIQSITGKDALNIEVKWNNDLAILSNADISNLQSGTYIVRWISHQGELLQAERLVVLH